MAIGAPPPLPFGDPPPPRLLLLLLSFRDPPPRLLLLLSFRDPPPPLLLLLALCLSPRSASLAQIRSVRRRTRSKFTPLPSPNVQIPCSFHFWKDFDLAVGILFGCTSLISFVRYSVTSLFGVNIYLNIFTLINMRISSIGDDMNCVFDLLPW